MKLQNKLLTGVLSTSMIVAPIAALVSCGGNSNSGIDENLARDLQKAGEQSSIKELDSTFFNVDMNYKLTNFDVLSQIINSKNNGMLDITRFNDYEWDYNGSGKVFGEPQDNSGSILIEKTTNNKPVLELDVAKKDFSKGALDSIANGIIDFQKNNPTKRYGIYVKTVTADNMSMDTKLYDKGVFKVSIYEMKQNSTDQATNDEFNNALTMLQSDKYGVASKILNDKGTFGVPRHMRYYVRDKAKPDERESLIASDNILLNDKNSTYYQDNGVVNKNNFTHAGISEMMQFGITDKFDMTTDVQKIENVKVYGSLEHNKQTRAMEAVFTVVMPSADSLAKTIHIPLNQLTTFNADPNIDILSVRDYLSNDFNFSFLKDLIDPLKGQLSMLDSNHFEETKALILEILAKVPFTIKANDVFRDENFYAEFSKWLIANKYNAFDLKAFSKTLELAKAQNISADKVVSWAMANEFPPVLFSFLEQINSFYDLAERFISTSHSFDKEMLNVASAEDLYKISKENTEWNHFLESHKPATTALGLTMANTSDKDATKLAIKWWEINQTNKTEVDAAAKTLGFTTQVDIEAHRTEIIAETLKHIDPLATLQADIDAHKGQKGWALGKNIVTFGGLTWSQISEIVKIIVDKYPESKNSFPAIRATATVTAHDADSATCTFVLKDASNNVIRTITDLKIWYVI